MMSGSAGSASSVGFWEQLWKRFDRWAKITCWLDPPEDADTSPFGSGETLEEFERGNRINVDRFIGDTFNRLVRDLENHPEAFERLEDEIKLSHEKEVSKEVILVDEKRAKKRAVPSSLGLTRIFGITTEGGPKTGKGLTDEEYHRLSQEAWEDYEKERKEMVWALQGKKWDTLWRYHEDLSYYPEVKDVTASEAFNRYRKQLDEHGIEVDVRSAREAWHMGQGVFFPSEHYLPGYVTLTYKLKR